MKKMKGIYLTQTEAYLALGMAQSAWMAIKHRYKMKEFGKKKKYFIPFNEMSQQHQQKYSSKIADTGDESIDDVLTELQVDADVGNSLGQIDIVEARKQKILVDTQLTLQKIRDNKSEMFSEWSERFFSVFEISFAKFKNSLIDCHMNEEQLKKLQENLDYAIKNLGDSLNDIMKDYLNEETAEDI